MIKKVVIIDDSSTQLDILKTLFTKSGWEVCGVKNAKIGYEMIFDFAPDLVITDAIMPVMGGFQLIKQIREDNKISRIPVIVYSVLNAINAKFYVNKNYNEYFLTKDSNYDKILTLASEIVTRHPMSQSYKNLILQAGLERYKKQQEELKEQPKDPLTQKIIQKVEEIYTISDLTNAFKELEDFSVVDEKIFEQLFLNLNKFLKYNLAYISVYSYSDKEQKIFFDISDIILSVILKNALMTKCHAKKAIMHKKYAPNMQMVVNESEFLSKLEFNFECKEENVARVAFYSKDKLKWQNEQENDTLKLLLSAFLRARHIYRAKDANKKEDAGLKYQKLYKNFDDVKKSDDMYFAILQIHNYMEIEKDNNYEDIDILNSKISENIIECIEKDEQIYKNDKNEYGILFKAKDETIAKNRLDSIIQFVENIDIANKNIEMYAIASSCNFEDNFDVVRAQKNVSKILEDFDYQEKVVFYNE